MKINLNGRTVDVPDGTSVGDVVRTRTEHRLVAVARNAEVVPRGEWDSTRLADGDDVEVLAPVAGG
jgi:sulfur carrier protein